MNGPSTAISFLAECAEMNRYLIELAIKSRDGAGKVIEICVGERTFVSTLPGPERNASPVGECSEGSINR